MEILILVATIQVAGVFIGRIVKLNLEEEF
jgi:hypothetical protein